MGKGWLGKGGGGDRAKLNTLAPSKRGQQKWGKGEGGSDTKLLALSSGCGEDVGREEQK